MKKSPRVFVLAAAMASTILAATSAQATLIAEQEYNGATFGFNSPFSGGTAVPGLTYSTLLVSGSAMSLDPFGQDSSFVGVGELSNNGTYYISWLNQVSPISFNQRRSLDLIASNYKDGNGPEAPVPFYGGGTGNDVVSIGAIPPFENEQAQIGMQAGNYGTEGGNPANPAYTSSFQALSGIASNSGVNMFLVKITQSPPAPGGTYLSTISLWYNPLFSDEIALGAPLETFTVQSFHLERIRLWSNDVWDEIRVGTTLGDVTPGLPVPESSSVLMLVLGLGFTLLFARKRTVRA